MGSDIAHPPSRTAEFRPAWTGRLDLDHRAELRSFFTRLDRESRCRRFGHAAADELLCLHADKALQDTRSTVGVFIDRTLRGVLELYPYAPAPILEGAIVVEQGWRRRGLGSALLRAGLGLACSAREHSIRLIFTRDNRPMRKLATNADARIDIVLDELCADIPIGTTEPSRVQVSAT
jgi:GNAT superfamily N-acetyltransferase